MISRRHLLLALPIAALYRTARSANVQIPRRMRVGLIFWRTPQAELEGRSPRYPQARALLETLVSHGWLPEKNVEVLWRSAEGDLDRLDRICDELVRMPVDVLAASGNEVTRAAMRHTSTIPIVMTLSTFPVKSGLIASLRRPGGNVTGLSTEPAADLKGKRLAFLKQMAPQVGRIAFLHDTQANSLSGGITPETEATARNLGLALLPYGVDHLPELEPAISDAVRRGADGLFVDTSLSAVEKVQPAFHRLAERYKLPAMHTYPNPVLSGGLMHYGIAWGLISRRAAYYIDRILRGARPADLPVEEPSSYELSINLRAARAIGLAVPESIRAQANRIIE